MWLLAAWEPSSGTGLGDDGNPTPGALVSQAVVVPGCLRRPRGAGHLRAETLLGLVPTRRCSFPAHPLQSCFVPQPACACASSALCQLPGIPLCSPPSSMGSRVRFQAGSSSGESWALWNGHDPRLQVMEWKHRWAGGWQAQ